jgi:hypothetical protein
MRLKFGEKRLTGKDKKIMEIWGSTDCYFADKEVLEIIGISEDEFWLYLKDLYRREPEVYLYFAECRKEMQKQKRFEDNIRVLGGDYLDDDFAWNVEQEFINNNGTNSLDARRKSELEKEHNNQY